MRHVPTSLYIDTEIFKGQSLRFDTKIFDTFTSTFAKGGIRLLVPVIMERELLRHFKRTADKTSNALIKAHDAHPIKKLGIVDLPSKDELKMQCFEEMKRQWSEFKEHFVVEPLPIVGNLENVIDWYFEVLPPFSEKKSKEFPDAFIISSLDHYNQEHKANIAVISGDGDFCKACIHRRYIYHFDDLRKYVDAFKPELSGDKILPGDFDLTKPITTEDLTELKAILARGSQVTSIEIQRVMKLLENRGSNYDFFFQNASDVVWLQHLSEQGYFSDPPNIEQTAEGHFSAPAWPPIEYLIRIFDDAPAQTLEVLSGLQDTDNFRILEGIIEIILKTDSVDAILKFYQFIKSYIEHFQWGHELIVSFLKKPFFFDSKLSKITPALLLKLIEFQPDPREEEKRALRKEGEDSWGSTLEPVPRVDQWEYKEILEKGVCHLAENEPYQVARILIDAVSSMIRLGKHQKDVEQGGNEDYSEIWCRSLDASDRDYEDAKKTLVHTLAYACDQVYERTSESIDALDHTLRNQRWKIFKRLRQKLYASHPNDQTLPWIREFILGHNDYSKWEYSYEFQLMVRKATEHFGPKLLNKRERSNIFDDILSGPSKEDFREWMGERYSEEAFQERQRYFHRLQLRPFAEILSGKHRQYFDELEREADAKEVTDDSYSPYGEVRSGSVSFRSPKSIESLESYTDNELLSFLNEWNEGHRDKDDWLVEVNIPGLAGVFQTLFKKGIVAEGDRLVFWLENRDKIERPIYVTAMLKVMLELVENKNFENLALWIEFCEWVLSYQDSERIEGQPDPSDESRKNPDWGRSRRLVVDFIDACVKKETDVPIDMRHGLSSLLQKACSQFDWRLDKDRPVLLNRDDPITEAINNTRSRALEALIIYGFWVRRHLPEDPVSEVIEILSNRICEDAEIPLTRPERAILGMRFSNLCTLNKDWAIDHRMVLFPQSNVTDWLDAFSSYIKFNRPFKVTFEILREDFEYALDNIKVLMAKEDNYKDLVDRLGQHLFTYYLWQVYPLNGEESLLDRFYERTNDDFKRWAKLFEHVGRSFRQSGKHVDKELVDRAIAYFDWRFEVAEPSELNKFSSWLEAECLDSEWRLVSFKKILDLGPQQNSNLYSELRALNKFLPEHLPLVIECFVKITDSLDQDKRIFLSTERAKPILMAGLNSLDDKVREHAERARENLLRIGRFDFLDADQ